MEFKSMDRKKEENDTTKLENPIMQETVRRRETRGESWVISNASTISTSQPAKTRPYTTSVLPVASTLNPDFRTFRINTWSPYFANTHRWWAIASSLIGV
jgi:hypothetical protein